MRLWTIACAIAISAPIAGADGVGVIAVSARDHASVSRAMAQALDNRERVVDDAVAEARAAAAAGAVPIEVVQRFRHVREQIDEGWRAYLRVQLDFAHSRLATARADGEWLLAVPGGAALYADAALKLGAVLDHIGRTREAQAIIALALALDPDRPITLAEFSPQIVTAVEVVRALAPELRHVSVKIEPPGARVSIDGKDVGRAPLQLDLTRGQHVMVGRGPQLTARALGFVVDDAREVTLELERDPESAALATGAQLGLPDVDTRALVEATLRFADLDEVVLVVERERRGEAALLVQRCVSGPTRCSAIVELGYGTRAGLVQASRSALQATEAAALRYTPSLFGDPRVTGNQIAKHCELCGSPWLWGGVGAVAVVGTAIVLAIVTGSRPPPIVDVDPMSFTH